MLKLSSNTSSILLTIVTAFKELESNLQPQSMATNLRICCKFDRNQGIKMSICYVETPPIFTFCNGILLIFRIFLKDV